MNLFGPPTRPGPWRLKAETITRGSSIEVHQPPSGKSWREFVCDRPGLRRVARYVATSALSTVASEVVLLALYGSGTLPAIPASVSATLVGTLPSYFLSRYWIWPEGNRRRVGRQVLLYWTTSGISLVVPSAVTWLAAAYAPSGRLSHDVVVGIAYVASYVGLWVAKFIVYQRIIFKPVAHTPT